MSERQTADLGAAGGGTPFQDSLIRLARLPDYDNLASLGTHRRLQRHWNPQLETLTVSEGHAHAAGQGPCDEAMHMSAYSGNVFLLDIHIDEASGYIILTHLGIFRVQK